MAAAIGAVVADISQCAQLTRIQDSRGNFHPQHLESGLALPVGPVLQAEGTELVVRDFSTDELSSALFEHTDFLFDGFAGVPRVDGFSL